MENQPIVRLNFTCDRNWEDLIPVENGRFCNDCQKKVVDFTNNSNDEIAAYLMSNTTKVCGKFEQSQLENPSIPDWKRWISTAAMFVAVFMGIKEASAQIAQLPIKKTDSLSQNNRFTMGEVVVVGYTPKLFPQQKIYAFNEVDAIPSFPSGEKAFMAYLRKSIPSFNTADAVGVLSFIVDKFGNINNVVIIRSANEKTDTEAIVAFKNSPKWKPGTKNGEAVAVKMVLPFSFTKKVLEKYKH